VDRLTRREWLKAGAAGLAAAALVPSAAASQGQNDLFSFHHDHILGTSLDLWLRTADAATAESAERVALAEVERLRAVFSLYDPESELCRLNRATGPVSVSSDLAVVLRHYERWQELSAWGCNAQVGAVARMWAAAQRAAVIPHSAELAALAGEIRRPGWHVAADGAVTRTTRHPLDLNAGAKGYILGRAAVVMQSIAPTGLVNLGGDLVGWGGCGWPLGIQDPFAPAENAKPLGGLSLCDAAVATSGGYQRFYTIDGVHYSHLLDPRTGRPPADIASATVIAPDSVTANMLATTLCVLTPEEGLQLVARIPGAECLLVTADGRIVTSAEFPLEPVECVEDDPAPAKDKPKADPWPDAFQVSVALEIPKIEGGRYRRPYVAVWAENTDGKVVRSLSVWGNSPKWMKELTDWWKIGRDDQALVRAVTRATRGPGKYEVVWDGKDDKGNALGQGTYTIKVEVSREHGRHVRQSGKIDCKTEAASLKLAKNAETGETVVDFGKKKQP
jgi:thiamine biosynthesis lipoprotein ApbE